MKKVYGDNYENYLKRDKAYEIVWNYGYIVNLIEETKGENRNKDLLKSIDELIKFEFYVLFNNYN